MGAPAELHLTQGPPETVARFNTIIDALWDRADFDLGPGLREIRSGGRRQVYATVAPSVASASATYAWQPYPSPWQGTGNDPHAGDRKLRFRLRRGKFAARTPANMPQEFVAFGDASDADIEEQDAVYTQVYLQTSVTEATLGSGDVAFARGTIKVIEGDDLPTALGALPKGGADGSVPAYIVAPICEVSWWGGSLHFHPGAQNYLDCAFVVSGTDCDHAGRAPIVSAA